MKTNHKQFLTYPQQIERLKGRGLIVKDDKALESALKRTGYDALIKECERPFINPMTRLFEGNTATEDIISFYDLHKGARLLIYGRMCDVELSVHEAISYSFCSVFGTPRMST